MQTIDLTPTPNEYKRVLKFILEIQGIEEKYREWAIEELKRIAPDGVLVEEWSN